MVSIFKQITANSVFRLALVLVLGNAVWLIWSNRFPPLQDYPDWVYQGWVFSRALRGHSPPGYQILHYPVPNEMLTMSLGLLDLVFSPEISGKLVITLVIGLFTAGSIYLLTALNRSEDNPLLFVPFVFLFNGFLFGGELAYLLGLGELFIYAGYLIRTASSPERANPLLILVASCVLFFTHIAAYAAAVLISAAVLCANFRKQVWYRIVLPFLPSVLLLGWSFVAQKLHHGPAADAVWRFWTVHQLAGAVVEVFSPFQGFLPWIGFGGPIIHGAAILNAASCVLVLCAIVATSFIPFRVRTSSSFPVGLATLFCATAVVAAGYSYGIFVCPGQRFLLPAGWLAFCQIGFMLRGKLDHRLSRIASRALLLFVIVQGVYYAVIWPRVSAGIAEQYAMLAGSSSSEEFQRVCQESFDLGWPRARGPGLETMFPTHAPLTRVPYYIYLEQGDSPPIFPTGPLTKIANGNYQNTCAAGVFVPRTNR
jgi:hypothetical protein